MSIGIYKHKPNQGFQKGHKIYYPGDKNFNKNGEIWKGRKHTEESKRKMSETQKRLGTKPPFRKGAKMPESAKIKIGNAQRGEKSYLWRGGVSFEPYSTDWTKTLKRSIRERDNYICQLCSQYGNEVHHIDYNKKNCNPRNLITLCSKCHRRTNFERDYWIRYFNNNFNKI
jgi:hypothetical protein